MFKKIILILQILLASHVWIFANGNDKSQLNGNGPIIGQAKKILIVVDNSNDKMKSSAIEIIKLSNLLGHFNTSVSIITADQYLTRSIKYYDVIFYAGFNTNGTAPSNLIQDILHFKKTVVWMNGGLREQSGFIKSKLGFNLSNSDTTGTFNKVKYKTNSFIRNSDNISQLQIFNTKKVRILSTVYSKILNKEIPYIVNSNNFFYVADIPFINVGPSDRYLLFSDLLHDFIGEKHPEAHHALVRIEDVSPIREPERLRAIANMLYERHIPFLIGVIPFFVNPKDNIHISLSDRPELVKALKYCVERGATIVMHGVTHQYKGETAIDFEFWDGSTNKPIKNEVVSQVEEKIETGLDECIKNGIYPLIWEMPHYSASISDYKIVATYFGSVIERRMLNEDFKYGQFFPYVIQKDMYGQKVYPENLGYIPLLDKRDTTEIYVHALLVNAKTLYNVRDGYASFFFHTFLNPVYLKEVVDSLTKMGYTFDDLRQQTNWVKDKDIIMLSGSQNYTINLNHSFLYEVYFNKAGNIEKRVLSEKPLNGKVSKKIKLSADEFYFAKSIKDPVIISQLYNTDNNISPIHNYRN